MSGTYKDVGNLAGQTIGIGFDLPILGSVKAQIRQKLTELKTQTIMLRKC